MPKNPSAKLTYSNQTRGHFESDNYFAVLQTCREEYPKKTPHCSPSKPMTKKPLQQNNLQNTNKTNKSKLIILADSHGRNLGHLIEQRTALSVCSHLKPDAKFYDVVKDAKVLIKSLNKNDYLLVIGSTNNMDSLESRNYLKELHSLISITNNSNLILATVPWRHDSPEFDSEISKVSRDLEEIAVQNSNVTLLPIYLL